MTDATAHGLFEAPLARVGPFSTVVLARLDTSRPLRVLDIGCGAGDQIVDLAHRLPDASFVGVDISGANIGAAEARRARMAAPDRLTFVEADYRRFEADAPFDVVISYSTLQFVEAPAAELLARVHRQLVPGGWFFNVVPYPCGYNRALRLARRALRAVRSPASDALLLGVGRMLHRGAVSPDVLRQRLGYAYMLPFQDDGAFRAASAAAGLEVVDTVPVPHASPGQLKHRITVFRRPAS
ncbi:MAG: trans-aconitate 2-methyltransferase [Vicinamibacterales bacterium]